MFTTLFGNVTAILGLLKQDVIKYSTMLSVPSAVAAAIIKFFDMRNSFLEDAIPGSQVFALFSSTVGLLLVFRSVRALDIYKEGSRGVHQMVGAWYDSASTLFAFCRSSAASREAVRDFKSTIVRLFSLLNMLCLVQLEDAEDDAESHAWGFKAIDMEGLDANTLTHIAASSGKAEVICQKIQCLIVDSIHTGVLDMPAPILSRSFQDLGDGMLKFHDTVRLSHSPIPVTLPLVAELLLLLNVIVSPLWLAFTSKGPFVAGLCAFLNNFVFFTLNSLAVEIENPFGGDFNDIDVRRLHEKLSDRLMELLEFSDVSAPKTAAKRAVTEIQFHSNTTRGWIPKDSRETETGSKSRLSKRATRVEKKIQRLFSNVIESSQVDRRPSDQFSVQFSTFTTQQSNTKPSTSFTALSSQQTSKNSNSAWSQEYSGQPSVPSMHSSSQNPVNKVPGLLYNHENEAFTAHEEACSEQNEASPITPAASDMPASRQLGQALGSLREADENKSSMPVCPMHPEHQVLLL